MPVPKRRTSIAKARSRRAANMKYDAKTFTYCQECGEPKFTHHICPNCGKYAGKQLIKVVKK